MLQCMLMCSSFLVQSLCCLFPSYFALCSVQSSMLKGIRALQLCVCVCCVRMCVCVHARVCTLQRLYYIVHYDIRISGYMKSRKYLRYKSSICARHRYDQYVLGRRRRGGGIGVHVYSIYYVCVPTTVFATMI